MDELHTGTTAREASVDAFVASRSHRPHWSPVAMELRPRTAADGYRLQREIYDRLGEQGVIRTGYKIGCTSPESQGPHKLLEPIYAGIFEQTQASSLKRALALPLVKPSIECEIAFRISRDLDGRSDLSEENLIGAISTAYVACEVVDNRYGTDPSSLGVATLLADDFLHAAFVLGQPITQFNAASFAGLKARIEIDGRSFAEPSPQALSPLAALAWLVRKLDENQQILHAGEIVMTGSLLRLLSVDPQAKAVTLAVEGLGALSTADDTGSEV